jgi:hypothetical protein
MDVIQIVPNSSFFNHPIIRRSILTAALNNHPRKKIYASTLHILSLIRLALTIARCKGNRLLFGCWILKSNESRLTCRALPWRCRLLRFILGDGFHKLITYMKSKSLEPFSRKSPFYILGPIWRAFSFAAGSFILSGNQLGTGIQAAQPFRSYGDARHHVYIIHPYIHTHRQTEYQKPLFHKHGSSKRANPSIYRDGYATIIILSPIY